MSKSISPRATAHDWDELLRLATHADRQLSAEELDLWRRGVLDGTANGWNLDLLHALQKAAEGREFTELLRLLEAGIPIAGFMTPILADVLRSFLQGTTKGRPKAFTAIEDQDIRSAFNAFTHPDIGMTPQKAIERLARIKNRSADSIRRSLRTTS